MPSNLIKLHAKELVIVGLLVLGLISYVPTYILILNDFDEKSEFPFAECAEFLASISGNEGVFTMHPDLLERYYDGPIYKIPEEGGLEYISVEAKRKGVKYLLIESTCITSEELIELYYHSVYSSWGQIPSEFVLLKTNQWSYGIYYIQTEIWFDAAVFAHSEWGAATPWKATLATMGASITEFDDSTNILTIDLSEFDLVVFADFYRPLSDTERLHLEESIQKGLHVIVSGLSSYYIAGGTTNLTSISQWFGANLFSEAPATEKWKVKFTENATEVMKDVDLKVEYAFYTNSDWSTPTGCVTDPESIVYAYRVNDDAATIFTHQFGEGISIFVGPRDGFYSSDAEIFTAFLRSLILSQLE